MLSQGFSDNPSPTQQPVKPWLLHQQPSNDFSFYSMPVHNNQYTNNNNGRMTMHQYPAYASNALCNIQEGSQQLTNTLSSTMATLSSFVQLVDTAVYSAWSSLTSLLALIGQLSNFHQQYIRGGLETINLALGKLIRILFSYSPTQTINGKRVVTILLGAVLALSFLVKKSLNHMTLLERTMRPAATCRATATYAFAPNSPHQIPLIPGQNIHIAMEDVDVVGKLAWIKGWTESGQCGFFPANYVSIQ